MTVRIAQTGGRRVGGIEPGSYTCTRLGEGLVAVPMNAYGRTLVRRRGRLAVKLTLRLINGSGVTNTRVLSGVIRPEWHGVSSVATRSRTPGARQMPGC